MPAITAIPLTDGAILPLDVISTRNTSEKCRDYKSMEPRVKVKFPTLRDLRTEMTLVYIHNLVSAVNSRRERPKFSSLYVRALLIRD